MYLRSPATMGYLGAARRIPRRVQTSALRIRQSLGRYRGGLRGLGDDTADPSLDLTDSTDVFSAADIAALTPTVGPDANSALPGQDLLNSYNAMVSSAIPPQDPLDYVTPQAAVAAGLPANQVSASWGNALSKYPTAQAAVAAGIPAGVVTQYYTGYVPTTSGISGTTVALVGGGLLLLLVMSGRKR